MGVIVKKTNQLRYNQVERFTKNIVDIQFDDKSIDTSKIIDVSLNVSTDTFNTSNIKFNAEISDVTNWLQYNKDAIYYLDKTLTYIDNKLSTEIIDRTLLSNKLDEEIQAREALNDDITNAHDTAVDESKVEITKSEDGLHYTISQGGNVLLPIIDIPKHMVINDGAIVKGIWNGDIFTESSIGNDKALRLTLANSDKIIYINLADLGQVYNFIDSDTLNVLIKLNDDKSISVSYDLNASTARDLAQGVVAYNTINTHIADKNNPHDVTKDQIGLGNVDNTSDTNKPISTATQIALDNKANVDLNNLTVTGTNVIVNTKVNNAYNADKAISDANGDNIANTYLKKVDGVTDISKGDGNNTIKVTKNGVTSTITFNDVATATNAINDSDGNKISDTYVKKVNTKYSIDDDKTTIQLDTDNSTVVINKHQDISGKQDKDIVITTSTVTLDKITNGNSTVGDSINEIASKINALIEDNKQLVFDITDTESKKVITHTLNHVPNVIVTNNDGDEIMCDVVVLNDSTISIEWINKFNGKIYLK